MEVVLVVLSFVLGGATGAVVVLRSQRPASTTKQPADEGQYKQLWQEAVNLLGLTGRLSDEQIASIMPSKPLPAARVDKLPSMPGYSSDRRDTEIARAKAGLPPADNLAGMYSSDIRKVHQARIEYGTAR